MVALRTADSGVRHTVAGAAARSTSARIQRRQAESGRMRDPMIVKRFRMSQPFGTMTVSRLRVSTAV